MNIPDRVPILSENIIHRVNSDAVKYESISIKYVSPPQVTYRLALVELGSSQGYCQELLWVV